MRRAPEEGPPLYVPVFRSAMRHRWVPLTASVVGLACAIALFTRVGAEFVPQLDGATSRRGAAAAWNRTIGVRLDEPAHGAGHSDDPRGHVGRVTYWLSRGRDGSDGRGAIGRVRHAQGPWPMAQGPPEGRRRRERDRRGRRAVPEVAGAVSQPIQMRTNELLAGVRSDVAVPSTAPTWTCWRRSASASRRS